MAFLSLTMTSHLSFLSKGALMPQPPSAPFWRALVHDCSGKQHTTFSFVCSQWGQTHTQCSQMTLIHQLAEAHRSPFAVPTSGPRAPYTLCNPSMMFCQQSLGRQTASFHTCWAGMCPCRTAGGLYCRGWPSNGYLASPESQEENIFTLFSAHLSKYFPKFSKLSKIVKMTRGNTFRRIKKM